MFTMKKFKMIDHTADIGIQVYGRKLDQLFENAALGMFDILCDIEKVNERNTYAIEISGKTTEELLHAWLGELLYRQNTEGMLFMKFKVEINGNNLTGKIKGEKYNPEKHCLKKEIKAVTYNSMQILQPDRRSKKTRERLFRTKIIFDV